MKQPPAGRSLVPAARDELWRELAYEIVASPAPVVILSSEEFDRLDQAEISSVAQRLHDHDIVPVIFLRNHADLIETMFRTHVVHLGYAASIQRFAAEEAPRLDFANMARDWMTVARPGAGIIMSYEDGSIRRDSVAAFRNAVELDADCLGGDQPVFVNTSAPAFVCEMVRHLRDQHADEVHVRQWIDEVLRVDFGSGAGSGYVCMPRELSAVLQRRFEAETTAIASDAGLRDRLRGALTRAVRTAPTVISDPSLALAAFAQGAPSDSQRLVAAWLAYIAAAQGRRSD